MTVNISIKPKTVVQAMGIVIGFFALLLFIYITRQALTLIAISFFLAMALNPPVSMIASRLPGGDKRGVATAISYVAVLSILGLILYATIPSLVRQSEVLINNIPQYVEDVRNGEGFLPDLVEQFQLEDKLEEVQDNLSPERLTAAGGPILSFFQRISSSAVSVLTVLVLTFFMLVEGPRWVEKFWQLHPKEHRAHRQHLAQKMYKVVTGYVNAQLLVAFIASMSALIMMTTLKLFGINIPFIIPMAAVIGVFGLIPLIGATIGAVIVVAVALFESLAAALIMLVFFVIYQQIENNAIQPIVQARSVELSPLVIFIAAIIGVNLAGLLGAILAIPVAAFIRILLLDYLEHHRGNHSKPKKA